MLSMHPCLYLHVFTSITFQSETTAWSLSGLFYTGTGALDKISYSFQTGEVNTRKEKHFLYMLLAPNPIKSTGKSGGRNHPRDATEISQ